MQNVYSTVISIHILLAECDGVWYSIDPLFVLFQSTHSSRSATNASSCKTKQKAISIHALLAECDRSAKLLITGISISIHALLAECDYMCELGS